MDFLHIKDLSLLFGLNRKAKFGDSLKSKTKTAQYNEVLCKILCHNLCVLIHEMHELNNEVKHDYDN